MHVHSSDLRLLRDTKFESANRPEITRLFTSGMFWNDLYTAHLDEILDAALQDEPSDIARIAKSDEDKLFLESVGLGRKALKSAAAGSNRYRIGHEFDFLVKDASEWNLCRIVNYLNLNSIRPTKRVAVLTSVRNEGINILEWLAHYRMLGVDSIIIYTNGNDDGSDELLASLSKAGLVTVVQNRTLLKVFGDAQQKAFEHAINFLPTLWDHEWIFFNDADEFLVLRGDGSIGNVVNVIESVSPHSQLSGMCLNWKWFGSDAQFHHDARPVLEKYTHSRPSRFVKTIFKLRDVTGFQTAHCPRVITGCYFVDASLSRLDGPNVEIDPVYDAGQINHYWNKSFEEFLVKNMRSNWERNPKQFFEWGNMVQGDHDPLPFGWADKVKAEINRLLEFPGVREQSEAVREKFKGIVDALDREKDMRRIYEDAKQAAASL